MKRFSRVIEMVFLVGMIVFFASCSEKKIEVPKEISAPKLDVRDVRTGKTIDISQFNGKVVFVNFWASWCPPCKEEMPSIEAMHRELMNKDQFLIVTILYKDDAKTAMDYMRAHNYTFPVFTDNDGISAINYGVTGVPETYLIDKKGTQRRRVIGPADWNSSEAKAFINSLLSE